MAGIVLHSILPKKPILDVDKFERGAAAVLNEVIDGVEKDFVSTYPNPDYTKNRANATQRTLTAKFFSSDEIFNYAVLGTQPHLIVARRAPALRFQTGYNRKVTPGKIGRNPGGGPFGPVVWTKAAVLHPGYEGSHVDETIADKWQPILEDKTAALIKDITN